MGLPCRPFFQKCLYPTADGTPCENPVSSGIDHCAAGHPVQAHKINVSYIGSCNDPSLPQEGTLDAEDIIGIALDAPETTKERRDILPALKDGASPPPLCLPEGSCSRAHLQGRRTSFRDFFATSAEQICRTKPTRLSTTTGLDPYQ